MPRITAATAEEIAAGDAVRDAARSNAPDIYLAALLAPSAVRRDLVTLAAFSGELAKIPQIASDPHIGEIRVQWWRDALHSGAKSGNPIADAMADTISRRDLPLDRINDVLDATVHSLYADPPANDEQLALDLQMRHGVPFALAARILGTSVDAASSGIIHHAAQAYGLANVGLTLPFALARGRNPLPPSLAPAGEPADWRGSITRLCARARSHLEHARAAYPAESKAVKTALLPLALVEPYLRVLSRKSHDPCRDIADIAPLTRAWRLVKTQVRGRF
jgi:phytoene synthase